MASQSASANRRFSFSPRVTEQNTFYKVQRNDSVLLKEYVLCSTHLVPSFSRLKRNSGHIQETVSLIFSVAKVQKMGIKKLADIYNSI